MQPSASTFWQYKVYADIHLGGVVENGNFRYFFRSFRGKANIIM